jgi:hypothetical protein
MSGRRRTGLAALAAGCGVVTACGGTHSAGTRYLDTDRVARAITQSIAAERHLRARVICPGGVVQRKGFDFACLAVYGAGQTTFTVTQIDDKGHVSYAGR